MVCSPSALAASSRCRPRRLVAADDTGIAFRWKDYRVNGPGRWKTMRLHPTGRRGRASVARNSRSALTSNPGLCGAFNAHIDFAAERPEVDWFG